MLYALSLIACIQQETYPDYWTDLHQICKPAPGVAASACDNAITEALGDETGLSIEGMRWLILEADPWLTDMVSHNIKRITTDCSPIEGAWAHYSSGRFDPNRGRVCVGKQGKFNWHVQAAELLVHEAGHGRPGGRHKHIICGPEAGEATGKDVCDADYQGALGAEYIYWSSMLDQPEPLSTAAAYKLEQLNNLIQE